MHVLRTQPLLLKVAGQRLAHSLVGKVIRAMTILMSGRSTFLGKEVFSHLPMSNQRLIISGTQGRVARQIVFVDVTRPMVYGVRRWICLSLIDRDRGSVGWHVIGEQRGFAPLCIELTLSVSCRRREGGAMLTPESVTSMMRSE